MIASILLGFLAAVLSLLGLKCTNIGLSDEEGKMKFTVTGGFLFILGGNIKAEMRMLSMLSVEYCVQFRSPQHRRDMGLLEGESRGGP